MLQTDIKKLLALITLAGFFGIIVALFFVTIPQANLDLAKTLVIALISIVSAVGGYYFGSSEGSARKTELMGGVIADPPAAVTTPPAASQSEAGYVKLPLLCLVAAFACIIALTGCAASSPTIARSDTPLQTAGKSLLAVKSSIVTAATATDNLCKQGKLTADTCSRAKVAYETAKPAYDAAVDAYLLMSSGGGDPALFREAIIRVQGLTQNLLLISSGGAK